MAGRVYSIEYKTQAVIAFLMHKKRYQASPDTIEQLPKAAQRYPSIIHLLITSINAILFTTDLIAASSMVSRSIRLQSSEKP